MCMRCVIYKYEKKNYLRCKQAQLKWDPAFEIVMYATSDGWNYIIFFLKEHTSTAKPIALAFTTCEGESLFII